MSAALVETNPVEIEVVPAKHMMGPKETNGRAFCRSESSSLMMSTRNPGTATLKPDPAAPGNSAHDSLGKASTPGDTYVKTKAPDEAPQEDAAAQGMLPRAIVTQTEAVESSKKPQESTTSPSPVPPTVLPTASISCFDSRENDELFQRWRNEGDERARERLILAHRNLVLYLARRFAQSGEVFEDVVQVGMVGLIRALDSFDATRGLRFSTFATPSIAGEIRRYFRDKVGSVRLPRRLQELQVAIAQKVEQLTHQLDRCPTYAEVGRALGLEAEEVAEVVEIGHNLEVASLDDAAYGEGEGFETLADQYGAPDPQLEGWGEHAALETALEKLPPKSRRVLELAYFEGHSQVEIARQLGVSQMQVSRVQRRALAELRKLLDEV